MTDHDEQLLAEPDYGIITTDIFLKNFSVDIKNDTDFVRTEMKNAIAGSIYTGVAGDYYDFRPDGSLYKRRALFQTR